jgi:hypothetical protein
MFRSESATSKSPCPKLLERRYTQQLIFGLLEELPDDIRGGDGYVGLFTPPHGAVERLEQLPVERVGQHDADRVRPEYRDDGVLFAERLGLVLLGIQRGHEDHGDEFHVLAITKGTAYLIPVRAARHHYVEQHDVRAGDVDDLECAVRAVRQVHVVSRTTQAAVERRPNGRIVVHDQHGGARGFSHGRLE